MLAVNSHNHVPKSPNNPADDCRRLPMYTLPECNKTSACFWPEFLLDLRPSCDYTDKHVAVALELGVATNNTTAISRADKRGDWHSVLGR